LTTITAFKFCSLSFQKKNRKKKNSPDVFWDPELLAVISMGVVRLAPLKCSDALLGAVVLPQDLEAPVLWHRTTSCLAQHSPAPHLS